MKQLILIPLLSLGLLPSIQQFNHSFFQDDATVSTSTGNQQLNLSDPGTEKMPAAVFKAQKFCRAELKDFDFNAHFSVVGADVYFAGTNFVTGVKGSITSSSLQPISNYMARCVPGTIVIFDNVKVVGPDNQVRSIPGLSLVLR